MTRPTTSSSASETGIGGIRDGSMELTLPFGAVDRAALAIAGGKAANLGELIRAGLPVPSGFCVTTTAYGQIQLVHTIY